MRTTRTIVGGWRRWMAALLLVAVAACGGGGGDGGAAGGQPAPGAASGVTIGRAGGSVDGPDALQVVVPADALTSETTIRVAIDSTGAPGMPADLPVLGSVYAITPHGAQFEQPVTVRVPVPPTTLQANQRLALAKAQPGGEWEVLLDAVVDGGMLVGQVNSFSYFAVVVVTYPVGQGVAVPPLAVTSATLDCGDEPCNAAVGAASFTYTVVTNSGAMPSDCRSGRLEVGRTRSAYLFGSSDVQITPIAPTGGTLSGTVYAAGGDRTYFGVRLKCPDRTYRMDGYGSISFVSGPAYPALAVLRSPAQVDVVEGQGAIIEAILAGGASGWSVAAQRLVIPTSADRAVIDWQRSDDQGASWTNVAQSFQDEANARPEGAMPEWKYWSVRHSFVASAADQGALIRVRACYTPPDAPAPPCVSGPSARLNVLQQSALPQITTAPRPVLVRTGQTASFSALASGTPTPALQWQTRDANSSGAWSDVSGGSGASSGNFTTQVLSLVDNGRQYRVVASNAVGRAESTAVTVSVSDLDVAPTITTQPATIAVPAGSDAVFAVDARGTEALSYQWRYNGAPIAGANATVLRLAAVTNANAGRYSVVVSNGAGSATSGEATLDVTAGAPAATAPTIVTQPVSVLTHVGNTATFGVGVAGTGPFSYQWLKAGLPIASATAATYSMASATLADAGSYAVLVSNAVGSVTSWNVVLTVNEAAQPQAPVITTQPSPQVQLPGGSATFAVAAGGSGPIGYQWLKNGAPIAGATGSVLTLTGVTGSDAGSYAVNVTNSLGGVTSSAATLTVVGAPVIGTQPAAQSVTAGGTASFSVSASGSGLRYQWTLNGVAIVGATASSYTTPATTLADNGGVYSVVVYNGAGITFSQGAVLGVAPAPVASPEGKIAAGLNHTCAIGRSDALYCWGNGSSGELGNGSASFRAAPTRVSGLGAVKAVAAGSWDTCAIDSTDALWCWGSMGDWVPAQLSAAGVRVRAVSLGSDHGCYVDDAGQVFCWGSTTFGKRGDLNPTEGPNPVRRADDSLLRDAVAVAVGVNHSCAQLADGSVWCWGADVAYGIHDTAARVMRRLPDGSRMDFTATGRVVAGRYHTCALESSSGQPMCWGHNEQGQLGDGTTNSRDDAMPAGIFGAMSLAAGATHTCAIRTSDMYCWGYGFMGNGGERESLLSPLAAGRVGAFFNSADPPLVAAAGERHTCALRTSGDVQCWGWNNAGQAGIGSWSDTVNVLVPTSTTLGTAFWGP